MWARRPPPTMAEPPVLPEHVHLGDRCVWWGTTEACTEQAFEELLAIEKPHLNVDKPEDAA